MSKPVELSESDLKPLKTKCPMCEKKGIRAFRPFCSKRCKSIDLGNWVTGAYFIPGEDAEAQETQADLSSDGAGNNAGDKDHTYS